MNNKILIGANIIVFILTLVVNLSATFIGINGRLTNQVSDLYPNLFTPANYVFGIWSVIYLLLAAFIVFQALPSQRKSPFIQKIGYLFILSCIVNMVWLLLFHYLYITYSTIAMALLLLSLIAIYLKLDISHSKVSLRERIATQLPFSVYLGWITVATVANIAAALVSINWGGLGLSDVTWTVLVLLVALVITLAVIVTRKDIGYSAVLVWAGVGIAVKQAAIPSIATTAEAVGAVIVIALAAVYVFSWARKK